MSRQDEEIIRKLLRHAKGEYEQFTKEEVKDILFVTEFASKAAEILLDCKKSIGQLLK